MIRPVCTFEFVSDILVPFLKPTAFFFLETKTISFYGIKSKSCYQPRITLVPFFLDKPFEGWEPILRHVSRETGRSILCIQCPFHPAVWILLLQKGTYLIGL